MTEDAIDITLRSIRSSRELQYENYQVVSAVQALWGAITPEMIAISLRCKGPAVHLYFYLEAESEAAREEIEDVVSELGSLQFTDVPIHTHIDVVGTEVRHEQIDGRLIYRRHPPSTTG